MFTRMTSSIISDVMCAQSCVGGENAAAPLTTVSMRPYFASASTGTASAAEVWGNDRAWLQAVDSPYDQSVSSHWNTNGNSSGTARFSSPLGVDDFVKKSSFLYYTREALGEVAPRIADFAEREGLHAHARSVTIRYEK